MKDGRDVNVEASHSTRDATIPPARAGGARKLNRVGSQDVGVALEDKHWRRCGRSPYGGADLVWGQVPAARRRASQVHRILSGAARP